MKNAMNVIFDSGKGTGVLSVPISKTEGEINRT